MPFSIRTRLIQSGAIVAAALLAASAAAPLQAATGQAAQHGAQRAEPARRICVRVELPATRVPRRICRTEAEWARSGGVPTD